ncbi:MAG: GNAT family N-acetyltransferase [Victivallaceae bacterium]|nr:GNAT family N-acetyltransferase [Victivallaceae bacterium]
MKAVFRPYQPRDIERCAELAKDAWPVLSIIGKDSIHSVMKAYIKMNLLLSDCKEVCYYNKEVIGFIFGSINQEKNFSLQRYIKANKLFWGFLTGKYGKIEKKYRFLVSVILTVFKVELLCRKFDSEINLIVIDKEYRGLGIGTKLITRFLEKAKQKGSKSIYLYTDIESNWKFYEIYGFNRYREFYDYELSFLKDKNICSYIYVYNI